MKGAWDAVKTWEDEEPTNPRTPVPKEIALAMFVQSMLIASASSMEARLDWIVFGVGVWVCFKGLLRPSEWCKLRCRDVLLPGSMLFGNKSAVVLALQDPKNKR